jgi:hypothetical protein
MENLNSLGHFEPPLPMEVTLLSEETGFLLFENSDDLIWGRCLEGG